MTVYPGQPNDEQNRIGELTQEDLNKPLFARDDMSALEHVRSRYRGMYQYKLRYTQRNNTHYEMYRGYNRPVTYPFHKTVRANIHVPYAFATVEQAVPRIVRGCLGDGYNFFDLQPREKTDKKNAEQHKKLLLWQINLMNFYIEFTMMIKTTAMYGYCTGKVDWVFQTGTKYRLQMKDEYTKAVISEEIRKKYGHALYEEIEEENEIIMDNNRFQALDWDEAYPDEAAKYTLHTGRDFIHQTRKTLKELYERKRPDNTPLYTNLDKVQATQSYTQEDADQDRRLSVIGAAKATWRQASQSKQDLNRAAMEVVIWEYWTPEWVVTVANTNTVIRRDRNFFWHGKMPFVDLNYTYIPNELFGIGAIESFRDLQTAIDTITNMDLDNWAMQVNQMHVVHRAADIAPEQLVSRPWGVIYSSLPPHEAVMPLEKQSIASETSVKQQEMRSNIMLASGLTDMHYLGTSSGSRIGRTATGMNMAQEETNTRFQSLVTLAEFMTLKPLLKMMASNNEQFMRTSKWVQIVGEEKYEKEAELIHPEEIWGEVDIIFHGAQRLGRQQMKQSNFMNLLKVIGSNPAMMNQVKPRELLEYTFQLFMESSDNSRFLVPSPEDMLTPEAENALMMWEQDVEPDINENVQDHLEAHFMAQSHPTYKNWTLDAQILLERHIEATLALSDLMQGQGGFGEEIVQGGPEQEGALIREASGAGQGPGEPGPGDRGPSSSQEAGNDGFIPA